MNDADLRSDQFNLKNVFATMLRGALGLAALSFMIVTLIGLYGAVDAGYDVVNHFRIWIVLPALPLLLSFLLAPFTHAFHEGGGEEYCLESKIYNPPHSFLRF